MRRGILRMCAVVTLVAIVGTGCETMQANPKTTIGAVGGGALGGLIAGDSLVVTGPGPVGLMSVAVGKALNEMVEIYLGGSDD